MLDTIGLLKQTPTRALMEIMGVHNGVALADDTIEVLQLNALTGRATEAEVRVRKNRDLFTKLPLTGSVTVTYNRLDLTEFFSNTHLEIKLNLPCTTHDLISVLSNYYSYVFDTADFVIDIITVDNASQYALTATPRSLRWVGSLVIDLIQRTDIEELTTTYDLGSLELAPEAILPILQHKKQVTDGLYCGFELKSYKQGVVPDLDSLAIHLTRLYYDHPIGGVVSWVNSITPSPHNVSGIEVIFNGQCTDYNTKPWNTYNHRMLVLRLSDTLCTDITGELVIYYNARVTTPRSSEVPLYRYPAELLNHQVQGSPQRNSFTPYAAGARFIEEGFDVSFLDAIYRKEGLPQNERWVCTENPRDFNLYGATVEYLGWNNSYPDCWDPRYPYVWVVKLNDDYCLNLTGRLIIYFNYSFF